MERIVDPNNRNNKEENFDPDAERRAQLQEAKYKANATAHAGQRSGAVMTDGVVLEYDGYGVKGVSFVDESRG